MLTNTVSWGKRCGATMYILKSILNMLVKKMQKWITLIWHVVKPETAAEGEGWGVAAFTPHLQNPNTFKISAAPLAQGKYLIDLNILKTTKGTIFLKGP